jgi:diguanylate cyclase (GGDEF)-like protein
MSRYGRILFFAAFVAVIGAAAWTQYVAQRSRADETSAAGRATTQLLDTVLQVENATRDYTVMHDPAMLDAYTSGRIRLQQAERDVRSAIGDDRELGARLRHEVASIERWSEATARDVTAIATGTAGASAAALAAARDPMLVDIRTANHTLARLVDRHLRDARDDAGIQGIVVIIALCVAFAVLNWALFVRTERREHRARNRQLTFAEQLQIARSEHEAQGMLARHLEAVAPGTIVIVTGDDDHSAAGRPITARGERIGTVTIHSNRDLRPSVERTVHDSILRTAPVLATLRTLGIAQARAATDPLTGLGNRRLVEDALARLVAQSRRTGEGFAVAMIDLDRFKSVNDTHGHEAGDALLVAVADALNAETREYDIVGRRGGDEFIVLLAGLDGTAAVGVMERCRGSIAGLRLGSPAITTTASFGVAAAVGGDVGDPSALVRAADDAVYEAKARGGNCVVGTALTAV